MASGSSLRVGTDLELRTPEVQLSNEFVVDGRRVALIDTPGFDDITQSGADVLEAIAAFLETRWVVLIHFIVLSTQHLDLSRGRSTLGGFLYLHPISDPRLAGIPAPNFEMFRKLCGKSTLENVIIVANMWGDVSWVVGKYRESELVTKFFKLALDNGAQLVRYHTVVQSSAHNIIRRITQNSATNPELNEQVRRHQEELKAVREEVIKVLRDQEEVLRREFEQKTLQRELEQGTLQGEFGQEIRRIREQTRVELDQEIRRFREQTRVASEWKIRKVQEQARAELEQEIHKVQEQARVESERARVESEQEIRRVKEQARVEFEQEIHKVQEQARVESEREIRKVREHTRNRGGLLCPP